MSNCTFLRKRTEQKKCTVHPGPQDPKLYERIGGGKKKQPTLPRLRILKFLRLFLSFFSHGCPFLPAAGTVNRIYGEGGRGGKEGREGRLVSFSFRLNEICGKSHSENAKEGDGERRNTWAWADEWGRRKRKDVRRNRGGRHSTHRSPNSAQTWASRPK